MLVRFPLFLYALATVVARPMERAGENQNQAISPQRLYVTGALANTAVKANTSMKRTRKEELAIVKKRKAQQFTPKQLEEIKENERIPEMIREKENGTATHLLNKYGHLLLE